VAHYAPDVVSFSVARRCVYAGDDVRDPAGIEGWFRATAGLRRTAAGWQITHEHDSTPY
jgi:ketosteroid isomerase-like protein